MVTLQERGIFTPFELLTDALKAREAQRVAREEIAAKRAIAAAANRADLAKARLSAQISREAMAAEQQKATAQDRLREAIAQAGSTQQAPALSPLEQMQQGVQMDLLNEYQKRRKEGMNPLDAMAGLSFGPTGLKATGEKAASDFELMREQRMREQMEASARAKEEANRLAGLRAETSQTKLEAALNPDLQAQLAASKAEGAVGGKKASETAFNRFETVRAAESLLPKLVETYKTLEEGDATTGIGAEIIKDINRARAFFSSDPELAKKVKDTEFLMTQLGSEVFPQIKSLGVGARGLDTPAERRFLQQVITGDITMNKDTLQTMLAFRMKAAQNAISSWNEDLSNPKSQLGALAKRQGDLNYYTPVEPNAEYAEYINDIIQKKTRR